METIANLKFKDLRYREIRRNLVEASVSMISIGAMKGMAIGLPISYFFRSKALGYFVFSYFVGIYMQKANYFVVNNLK
jgi:hypothetical protein